MGRCVERTGMSRNRLQRSADEGCRLHVAGAEASPNPFAERIGPRADDGVNQSNANCAAEITHEVEQTGLRRERDQEKAIRGPKRVGGSKQNMMAAPRTICGQNIASKSVRGS